MVEKLRFPIVKRFKLLALIALLFMITGVVSLVLLPFGVNLFVMDVDFAGGTTMHFAMHQEMDSAAQQEVQQLIESETDVTVSSLQRTGDGTEIILKTVDISTQERQEIIDLLKDQYGIADADVLQVDNVSSSVGREMQRTAFTAAILAAVLMMVYVAIRFEFTSGLAALTCLAHDLLVMLSFYVIFRIPLNMNFIAAILTILGYSINASIIVFDRVRENRRLTPREPFEETVERSIWQTVARNVNTTLTTVIMVGMIFLLGVSSLRNFTLPLLVGMIAGAYSSIFLSGPLWAFYRKKFRKRGYRGTAAQQKRA